MVMKKIIITFLCIYIIQNVNSTNYDLKVSFNNYGCSSYMNNISANFYESTVGFGLVVPYYDYFGIDGISNQSCDSYLSLFMDVYSNTKSTSTSNIASYDIYADLSGKTNYCISFWYRLFTSEDNNSTGVFMSDDGGVTFLKILSITNHAQNWQPVQVDLNEILSDLGLELNSNSVIRFQYASDDFLFGEGIAIDNIIFNERICSSDLISLANNNMPEIGGVYENGWYGTSNSISLQNTTVNEGKYVRAYESSGVFLQSGFECKLGGTFVASPDYVCEMSFKSKRLIDFIEKEKLELEYIINPNPNNGCFKIKFNQHISQSHIKIFNTKGEVEFQSSFEGDELIFESGSLSKGIHLFTINIDEKFYKRKIII